MAIIWISIKGIRYFIIIDGEGRGLYVRMMMVCDGYFMMNFIILSAVELAWMQIYVWSLLLIIKMSRLMSSNESI